MRLCRRQGPPASRRQAARPLEAFDDLGEVVEPVERDAAREVHVVKCVFR